MTFANRPGFLVVLAASLAFVACEELQTPTTSLSGGGGASATSSTSTSGGSPTGGGGGPSGQLTEHDVALRFLTAYVRRDRDLALQYATPQAVSKLDWNRPHGDDIPYYDDKMILHFRGGWARVYFQEVGDSHQVADLDVHHR